MNFPGTFRVRLVRRSSIVTVAAACLLAPGAAQGMSTPGGDALSPRLAELAEPAVRSAPRAEQAARLSLAASGPGSLLRDGNRVLVDVRFERGAAAGVDALRAAGAEIVDLSRRYQTVTVAVRPVDLPELGDLARVGGVTEVLTPIVRGADCGGSVRSEGDTQLEAADARASWGVDGTGVTVGILSDSFDRDAGAATHAAGDVASGDLPGPGSPCGSTTPVGILEDPVFAADEGRAMAQIVHDLAPGAAIDFATAFGSETQFAANIRALAATGSDVIVDDVFWFAEPIFQDGPVAVAANDVAAAGASYFSAAGNDNLIDAEGRDIGSWEAPEYRDSGSCPAELLALPGFGEGHCMDFNPDPLASDDTFGITVVSGATLRVDLQWAEPWNGVTTDLDAFLLDTGGELVAASGEDNVGKSQKPLEVLEWNNPGPTQEVQLAINHCFGTCNEVASAATPPRLKFVLLQNGSGVTAFEYPESSEGDVVGPTIFGHSGASGAIGVGAVRFNTTSAPEVFSSRGPLTHYFGPVLGITPALKLPSPETLAKPDVVATDGGANTFFGQVQGGVHRFYGTSAAAPHAAAVAALVRQGNPGATAAQVRAALTSTARPVGAFGPEAVGAGLVDAYTAVDLLALPPAITITERPQPLSRNRRPTIQFTANRPVAFNCEVDGSAAQPCASPFTFPSELSDGQHGVAVFGTDLAGRVGSSGVVAFTVDTRRPRTSIAKHPRKLIRTHRRKVRASFRFRSSEADSTFICKFDRGLLHFCPQWVSRRFEAGRHTVRVRARDAAGNVDKTPAEFRFRVKRVG
ncbi:MAG: S8 family serine peptidase [Solirubrobacterales bacterium]